METDEYARIAAVEDEHWWYCTTRGIVGDFLTPWLRAGQRLLDAGCGPGGNGAWLAEHGHVVGIDLAAEALAFVRARRPAIEPVRGSLDALPFPDGSFDVAVAITVVTCVPDDELAVRELARVLAPGGAVLLFEPALPWLRREHDRTVHSLHRYTTGELATLAARAGLHVERATYAYAFLVPPAAALAAVERFRPAAAGRTSSDVERRALDVIFALLAERERTWLARHDLPIGTSAVVVATKP